MTKTDSPDLRHVLERLTRLLASEAWKDDLTPTQMATLDYLARANRFSRAPSQVADFLGATRGTVSQTLKTLERKGLVTEQKSETDKRRINYDISEEGMCAIARNSEIDAALGALDTVSRDRLIRDLSDLLVNVLRQRGGRSFGLCHACRYHRHGRGGAGFCELLNVPLTVPDAGKICHEQVPAS